MAAITGRGTSRNGLDPREYTLALTAFTAGSVDVISFVRLGGVLGSAMTGNLAFLGLYAAFGRFGSAFGSLVALLGFMLGAAAGSHITRNLASRPAILRLLGIETVLLAGVALLWLLRSQRGGYLVDDTLILALSTAMGMQSICGKKINLSNIPTVVFTSTLTNIVIGLTEALAARRAPEADTKRQLVSLALYFTGALTAGLLIFHDIDLFIFLPLSAMILAFILHRMTVH